MPTDLTTRIKAIQKFIGVAETGILDMATCVELEKRANITVNSNNLITHIKNVQRLVNADDDGNVGPQTVTKIEAFINPSLPKPQPGASMVVSTKSLELVIEEEVSSKEVYNKKYQNPIWPGGDSGVTIGIGYDLGFNSGADITAAWGLHLSSADLNLLLTVKKLTGLTARNALPGVKSVKIPYDIALKVFYQVSMPVFSKKVKRIYPGAEKLPPDAQGALLSLVYNRGESLDPKKPSRREMRNIVPLVAAGNLNGIAREIRSMKRLWDPQKLPGLIKRREKEAVLVENASFNILPEDLVIV
jgi:hypothetical protein